MFDMWHVYFVCTFDLSVVLFICKLHVDYDTIGDAESVLWMCMECVQVHIVFAEVICLINDICM